MSECSNNTGKHYVIYWYPSLFHTSFSKRIQYEWDKDKNKSVPINKLFGKISDNSSDNSKDNVQDVFLEIEKIYKKGSRHNETYNANSLYSYSKNKAIRRDYASLRVTKKTLPQNTNIKIKYDSDDRPYNDNEEPLKLEEQERFILSFEERSNNGFVVYSYDKNEYDLESSDICQALYHLAKGFYHSHEIDVDKNGGDSSLKPLFITSSKFEPSKILRPDNCAIYHYLKQYEEILKSYAQQVSHWNASVVRLTSRIEDLMNNKKFIEESQQYLDEIQIPLTPDTLLLIMLSDIKTQTHEEESKYLIDKAIEMFCENGTTETDGICDKVIDFILKECCKKLSDLCNKALIEFSYCKTLLESKYNTEIRHKNYFTTEELEKHKGFAPCTTPEKSKIIERDEKRKIAVNILGCVRYIECVMFKCLNNSIIRTLDAAEVTLSNIKNVGKRIESTNGKTLKEIRETSTTTLNSLKETSTTTLNSLKGTSHLSTFLSLGLFVVSTIINLISDEALSIIVLLLFLSFLSYLFCKNSQSNQEN